MICDPSLFLGMRYKMSCSYYSVVDKKSTLFPSTLAGLPSEHTQLPSPVSVTYLAVDRAVVMM